MNTDDNMIALMFPDGRTKLSMHRDQYEMFCEFIFRTLSDHEKVTLTELLEGSEQAFRGRFNGDISWPILLVKRDLEARGLLKVNCEKSRIQVIELKKSAWKKLKSSGGLSRLREGSESAKPLSGIRVWYLNY